MVPSTCTCTCICANSGVQLQYSTLPLFPDRSFPRHKMFIQGTCEGKEGRAALFRVLAVYALYNPEVSYCQGNPTHAPVVFFLCLSSQVRWCLMGCVWLIAQVYWKNFIILTVKKKLNNVSWVEDCSNMCCDISIVKDTFYHCVYMIKASFQQKSLYPFWTLKELYLNAFMWFPELHLDPDRRSMYIIMNISFSFFRNVLYCRNVSYEYGRRGTVHFNNCPKKKKKTKSNP